MYISIVALALFPATRVLKIIPVTHVHFYFRHNLHISIMGIKNNTRVAMYIFIVDIAHFLRAFLYNQRTEIKRIWGCSSEQPQIVL